jgi:hypothetical protein
MVLALFIDNLASGFANIGPAYWNESLELVTICRRLISHKLATSDIEGFGRDEDEQTKALERLPSRLPLDC